jgi:hypothetical protein
VTVPAISAVGFCPHHSKPGDWALAYALRLARSAELQLNILLFLTDPFARHREPPPPPGNARNRLSVDHERGERLYLEDKLEDYLRVGCRVCEGDEPHELHRCLSRHEFQALVLPYPTPDAVFAGVPIEEFAESLVCPTVLVGPSGREEFRLNGPASLLADRLHVGTQPWRRLGEARARGAVPAQPSPVGA